MNTVYIAQGQVKRITLHIFNELGLEIIGELQGIGVGASVSIPAVTWSSNSSSLTIIQNALGVIPSDTFTILIEASGGTNGQNVELTATYSSGGSFTFVIPVVIYDPSLRGTPTSASVTEG